MKCWYYCAISVLVGLFFGALSVVYVTDQEGPKHEVITERESPDGSDKFQVMVSNDDEKEVVLNFVIDGATTVRLESPLLNKPSYHLPVIDADWTSKDYVRIKVDQDFGDDVRTYQVQPPSFVEIKEKEPAPLKK